MQVRRHKLSWSAPALLALALAACAAPTPRERPAEDDPVAAQRLADLGRPAEAARIYARAADRAAAEDAARLRIRAAELSRDAGDLDAARALLERVDLTALDDYGLAIARLLAAELALQDGRPAEALRVLPADPAGLPRALAARALRLQGDAESLLGRARAAVVSFVAREPFLEDQRAIDANHERIWRALRRLDSAEASGDDPTLDGWLALAELRRRAWQDPWRFDEALQDWLREYHEHVAARAFVPRLMQEQQRLAGGVREVALLLPLSGRFAGAGAAVRDGFLAALYRTPDGARRPRVRIYDVGDDPRRAVDLYREAVTAGADFVVGPLQKEAVAELARHGEPAVPVLALNTLDHGAAPPRLYRFGLVPEAEARQIAERAVLEGRLRAIALVPDSELGARMLQAFGERFAALGGTLLATEWYEPDQRDHSAAITRALAIDESRARQGALRIVLNVDLQVEPRRRRDADFVFVVATPQQGRSLRPQLRFHHASDLPVYASSHVYGGHADRSADADLDGVTFTDMPWVLDPDRATADARRQIGEALGAELERNTRLFALGYDAYRLAPVLRHDPALLGEPVPAATGALQLDDAGRIHRTLTWARFRGGLAQPLQALPPADGDPPGP